MKISSFAVHALDHTAANREEGLKIAAQMGIETVEIFNSELNSRTLKELKAFVNKEGIDICTLIIVSNFPYRQVDKYEAEKAKIKELILEAENAGVPMVMIVPMADYVRTDEDKIFLRDRIVEGMQEFVDYAKNMKVTITMENFSRVDFPYSTIEEMEYLVDNVKGLKINFDAGNFYCVYVDIIEAYERLKDHVVNVHMKDWYDNKYGMYHEEFHKAYEGCAIGSGKQPLAELMKLLKRDNYEGNLVIEINAREVDREDVEKSVKFLKENM